MYVAIDIAITIVIIMLLGVQVRKAKPVKT